MKKAFYLVVVMLITIVLALNCTPKSVSAMASSKKSDGVKSEDFYKGATVKVITGYGAGSGFVLQNQVVSAAVQKLLGATLVVEPIPAAGGTMARNKVFAAKPDGLTLTLVDHGAKLMANDLMKEPGVTYQWNKFTMLGKILRSDTVIAIDKKLPYNKPQDLVGKQFLIGASAPFWEGLFAEALGWTGMRFVPGYASFGERAAAVARGEIQAVTGDASILAAYSDTLKPLVFTTKHPKFPDVASVREGAAPGKEKWVTLIESWVTLMHLAYGPPGLPDERAKFLEEVLNKAWADQGLRNELEKMHFEAGTKFVTRADLEKAMKELSNISTEDIAEIKSVTTAKYLKK